MAVTYAGALKAYLEAGIPALSSKVFFRRAPENSAVPYAIVSGTVALVPTGTEDGGSAQGSTTQTVDHHLQVSLFQKWRDIADDSIKEDPTLEDLLVEKLHGAQLTLAPKRVYGVTVQNAVELPDPDPLMIHLAVTVILHRGI